MDQTLVNPNAALQIPNPQATAATTPSIQPADYNANAALQVPTPAPPQDNALVNQPQPTSTESSAPKPPTIAENLQTGSQGKDVSQLQDYLVQMGYLTPDQISTGKGTYGPQTTAAVAKLQQDLGIQAGTGSGAYGPQTKSALSTKYQNLFQSVKDTKAPDQSSAATAAITAASQPSTDPVFGAMASSLAPIMQSLNQVLHNINNPVLTSISLQQEYNDLASQNNLPALQSQMLNMQNVMNGTEDDIRSEITKAGGSSTESQVLALTASRNKVIMKQYNAVSTQYTAAQTNVSNMMQYATTDQQTQLQRQTASASVTESMASIESQMMNMGITMQQNAKQAVQYNVTQMGYTGLAKSAQYNPQVLGQYEQMLNLAPGTLSDPNSLSQLDTYKNQQLAIAQENAQNAAQRTVIYAAGQGVPIGGATSGTTFGNGNTAAFTIPPNSLTRPSWLNTSVPLNMSSSDMSQYLQTAKGAVTGGTAGTSQYGNNVTIQGVGNYVAQPDGSYILQSALPPELSNPQGVQGLISSLGQSNPPTLNYSDIAAIMQNAPGSQYSPASTPFYREQRSARQLLGNFTGSNVYATVAQSPLPFDRIQAAKNGDNSVSDTELLDSYITLAKGQGQITEAQISAITGASSMSDKLNIIKQKVAGAGALISADQRKSLLSLSGQVFDQYSNTYKNLYTQAINVLAKNHVEPAVWGVIPDFTTMITTGDSFAVTNGNAQPQ